jgi:urea transport system permease protein
LITKFPAIWTFFQGGLFLWIVLALPDGIVGWWRSPGRTVFRKFSGDTYVPTYPSLAEDPDVEYERRTIEKQGK